MANQELLKNPFSWTCPFCNSTTTINKDDFSSARHELAIKTKYGTKFLFTHFIVCPNPTCKEYSLVLQIFNREFVPQVGHEVRELEEEITVIPAFTSKIYPDYIPQPIRNDYYEACQIRELSPNSDKPKPKKI